MRGRSIGLVAAVAVLSGCASTATWQHPSRAGDGKDGATLALAECQRYAEGTGPAPTTTARMEVPAPTSYTTRGTYTQYGSVGTLNARTTANFGAESNFASGYNAGASLGDAIASIARQNQLKNVATACMRTLGWIDTSTPEGQASFQQAASKFAEKTASKNAAADQNAQARWETAIQTFFESEAARPNGIDYLKDKDKYTSLDYFVKELAKDPKNEKRSMAWFLVEAHRMVLLRDEWRSVISSFIEAESSRPSAIDYQSNPGKLDALMAHSNDILKDPKNGNQSLTWIIEEAHKMVLLDEKQKQSR